MSIKAKLLKGTAIVALIAPLTLSTVGLSNANAKNVSQTKEQKVVVNKISNKMYDAVTVMSLDLLPTVRDYQPTTEQGKKTRDIMLQMLDLNTSKEKFKKDFKKAFKQGMKNNQQAQKVSTKALNRELKAMYKAFTQVKPSDLNNLTQQAKRWLLVILEVNDGKTTITLPPLQK
ncbi:hypothetical protein FD06_GL000658 [Apilactobacillus ozensis DSM 23829 = JCM 17196]|uniref:DUF5105 domain-containing protein n=2 Tax=Apilactobacillus ozensis TaxID=866801 RepID=A0A0R2AW84_9LACO|nr:hypothetical protein [Apilactobacillus ozensis]KRM67507.1 hypothetical protein FD06_GL000658 [Apilactobacillus ozensis DSM 23829 = JCM 17196]